MFQFFAKKVSLDVTQREIVTSGSVNVYQCQFQFDSAWDGLEKTAVFKAGDISISVLLDDLGACNIPWEVFQDAKRTLYAGVYGTKNDNVVLPTIWANCGEIKPGVTQGENTQPPTPDVYSQILQVAKDAEDVAQSVRDDADSGKFNGEQGPTGPQGYTYTPAVSEEGVISWTNDGSLPNPSPVNIKGPQGKQGIQGVQGKQGERGYVYTPNVSQDGIISWTNDGDLENPDPVNITGPQGETGETPDIIAGTVETLEPGQDATAEITGETPNLVLNLGIPKGQPGQDAPQIDDDVVSATNPWSSLKIVDTLAPPFSSSGAIVTCNPVAGYPLHVVSQIMPVQEGEGDPSPDNVRPISGRDSVTVNVRGKNLVGNFEEVTRTVQGVTWTIENDRISAQGETGEEFSSTGGFFDIKLPILPATYIVSYKLSDDNISFVAVIYKSDNTVIAYLRNSVPYTLTENNARIRIYAQVLPNKVINGSISDIQLELGSTPTPYEPYQPGTTAQLSLPETIYGGTVDAVTGKGSKTWGFIASYNGEALPGEWISDRDVYAPGTTPTTGAQVAYKLATPEPFQAAGNQPLPAVAGLNTVYTDGDSVTVSGRADPNAVINNLAQRIAALEEQAING